jgi:hypothetical protein
MRLKRVAQILKEPSTVKLVFVSLGMLALLVIADVLVERRPFWSRTFWALFDVLIHGVVALVIGFPLLRACQTARQSTLLLVTMFLAATLIDLDHFVAAGSFALSDALSLSMRPPTHSLSFAVILGSLATLISRNPLVGWGIFASVSSHVLRDAAGGITSIVWPLPLQSIPRWTYYAGEVGLLVVSFLLVSTILTTRNNLEAGS